MSSKFEYLLNKGLDELRKEAVYCFSRDRPRKVFFDHIPKCGGSSLTYFLESNYPRRKTYTIDIYNSEESIRQFQLFPENKRHAYDLVKGHMANRLLDYIHPESLRVTVLRDPVDRIISHYYYVKRNPTHYLYRAITDASMSLEAYAVSAVSSELTNAYTLHFSGLTHEQSAKDPEEAVETAYARILGTYHVIGFLEHFDRFAEELALKARLHRPYTSEKRNVTADRPRADEVPASAIEAITRANQLDITLYARLQKALLKE